MVSSGNFKERTSILQGIAGETPRLGCDVRRLAADVSRSFLEIGKRRRFLFGQAWLQHRMPSGNSANPPAHLHCMQPLLHSLWRKRLRTARTGFLWMDPWINLYVGFPLKTGQHCDRFVFPGSIAKGSSSKSGCQLHLPTSHANLSRVTSPANFSCQLVESYFTCQLLMPTCRELLHLPTSHANLSRVTSPANFSCQLVESYFTCQLLMPTCRELLHLPTSHANLSRVTSRAYFSCQLVESYFTCLLLMSTFWELLHLPTSHVNFSAVISFY